MRLHTLLLSLIMVLMIALSGCIFSPDDDDTDPTGPTTSDYVFPDDPDKLMANFSEIHSNMDIDAYRDMVAEEYKFIMLPETIEDILHSTEYLTQAEDLAFTENMFNAISGFEITLEGMGSWEAVSDQHEYFPDALRRTYEMHAEIGDAERGVTYIVDGLVTFFVTSTMVEHEGAQTPYYQLFGQHDHTTAN